MKIHGMQPALFVTFREDFHGKQPCMRLDVTAEVDRGGSVVDLVRQESGRPVCSRSVVEPGANAAAGGVAEMAIAWRFAERHAAVFCTRCSF